MRSEVLSQEKNVLVLQVEKDSQEFVAAVRNAVRELSQHAQIKGFRKGRVPRQVLEMYAGKKAILDHAVEALVPDTINQVVEEYGLVLLEDPKIDVEKAQEGEPFVCKVTFHTRPEVTLPDLSSLEVERPVFPVTEEVVEATLEDLRHKHADWVPAEDDLYKAEDRSVVDVDYTISVEGEETENKEDVPIALWAPDLRNEIKEALKDKKKGDVVHVDIPIPEDHEEKRYAGKTANYIMTVKQVKKEELPELHKEFFQSVGAQEAESTEDFKAFLRKELEEDSARQSDQIARDNAARVFVEATEIELLPEKEVEKQYQTLKNSEARKIQNQFGKSLPEYLESQRQSLEDYEKNLRERAEESVRTRFAFDVLREEGNVEIKNADVEEEMRRIAMSTELPLNQVYEIHKKNQDLLGETVGRIQFYKTLDYLVTKVSVNDVPVDPKKDVGVDEEEA